MLLRTRRSGKADLLSGLIVRFVFVGGSCIICL